MSRWFYVFVFACVASTTLTARDPSFARSKHLVGVRFVYTNTEFFQASFGGSTISETGTSDGTTRTSAPIYVSVEPGRSYGLSVYWAPDNYYMLYPGTVKVEFFGEPDDERFVNDLSFGKAEAIVEYNPSDPAASIASWQVRVGSNLAVSPGIGQSRSLALGEVNWSSSLGVGRSGKWLDPLTLAANWTQTNGLSRAKLTAPAGGEVTVINDPVGEVRQILVPQSLIDVVSITNGFEVRYYPPSADAGLNGNLHMIHSGSVPMVVHRLTRPTPSSSHLIHTRVVGTDEETTEINPLGTNTWRRIVPGGLVIEDRSQSVNGSGNVEETRVFKGPDLISVRETLFEYRDFPWGREVIRRVEDPSGAALTTHYAFYDNPAQIATYGRLKHTLMPDGNWARQEYHLTGTAAGRLNRVLRPWLDAPAHPDLATATNCAVTTLTYVADWAGLVRLVGEETTTVLGTMTQRTVTQWDFSQSSQYIFDVSWGPLVPVNVATVSRYAGATATPEVSVTKTLRPTTTLPASFWNKPVHVVAPNGVATVHRYAFGIWNPLSGVFTANYGGSLTPGSDFSEYRTQSPLIAGKSLQQQEVRSAGQVVLNLTHTWLYPINADPNPVPAWEKVVSEEIEYNLSMKPVRKRRGPLTPASRSSGLAWTATYSAEGRLATETSEEGVEIHYTYDAMGRTVRKTVKGQASPTYGYSISLPSISDRIFEYRYDAVGNVVEEKIMGATESLVTTHVFDKAGRKTQTRVPGPAGPLTTTISYALLGAGGLQATTTAPDGGTTIKKLHRDGKTSADEGTAQVNKTWTYQVGIDGRVTTTVAEGPRWSAATADWLGRTVVTTRPTQAGGTFVETQEYNSFGQLVATSNTFPGSRAMRYVYNTLGEKIMEGVDMDNNGSLDLASSDRITAFDTRIAIVLGGSSPSQDIARSERITQVSTFATPGSATPTILRETRQKLGWWNGNEHAWESTTGDMGVTERQSVRSGTCKVTTSTGAMTEVTVEASGKTLRTIKGPITTTFQYDDCDRLVTQTDARKGDTEFTYFANSATLSAMIDPADFAASRITEVYHYNAAGRRVATVDALNQIRRVDYDLHGRVVKEWGSASYPVERIYCSCGKIAELRTYRGGTGWDGAAWPTATAGTFDKTTWTYGTATGLLLAKTDANNAAVTYAYDAAGRNTNRTWARGVVTTYAYDPATGALLSTTYSDSTPSVTYTYDRRGRIATVVDGVGSRTLSYSPYDQLTVDALTLTGFGTATMTYTYDVQGRRASMTSNLTPTGGAGFAQNHGYGYATGTGLLATVGNSTGFTYTYLANSALPTSITYGGSAATSELVWAPHRDELVTYDNRSSGGMISDHRFDYTRDATSRITQETQSLLDGQTVTNRAFSYNARSELTSDAGSGLSYDAQGNRTTGYGTTYQANALNQYTTVAGVPWTYDADGNPLSDGVRTFVYDAENRLVQAGSHTFSYDYRHRLVKAVGPSWPSGPSATSWRLYDGDKVVLREDRVSGYTLRAEYIWGRDLAGRHLGGDGTGGLLAVISNSITYVPHYDGRGNIWRFSGGSLRSMNAFGDLAVIPYLPPSLLEQTLLTSAHGTKEYFYGLGLYHYGRRFYDAKNGRFVGRDPIAEEGGLNLYSFVRNNPLNLWDYLGLAYGDTHADNENIPDGYYDVGDGKHACPFGYAWDGESGCVRDDSAPTGPRSGTHQMDPFEVSEPRSSGFLPFIDASNDGSGYEVGGVDGLASTHPAAFAEVSVHDVWQFLQERTFLGGRCCNSSMGVEWALVGDGRWRRLEPGDCTGRLEDCDGMTCGGGFYKVGMLNGNCSTPGNDSPPFDGRRWEPDGGGDSGAQPPSGPGGRGGREGNFPDNGNYPYFPRSPEI
jgi:RHS repeat-associated protein